MALRPSSTSSILRRYSGLGLSWGLGRHLGLSAEILTGKLKFQNPHLEPYFVLQLSCGVTYAAPSPGIGLSLWQWQPRVGNTEPWQGSHYRTPLLVPQCRELYYCVKDSMERAAARQQSIKPGEERSAPTAPSSS